MSKNLLLVTVAALMLAGPSVADEKHDHGGEKGMSFASVSAGIKVLDELIAEARSKIGKGDFDGLHETAEEVHGAADGLAARLTDVSMENKERYKFNTEQLKSLSSQLEEAHEAKNKVEAEKVAKRLEGVRDRLKALAPAG
jgi:hypothetical protein